MKIIKKRAILLIIIIIALIAVGYVAGAFVYIEYRIKTAHFNRQVKFTLDKFEELEGNIKNMYLTLENMVDEGRLERKKVLSRIEDIKEDIKEWEKGYGVEVSELRGRIEDLKVDKLTRLVDRLQDEIDEFKLTVQDLDLKLDDISGPKGVDLGKISVKK